MLRTLDEEVAKKLGCKVKLDCSNYGGMNADYPLCMCADKAHADPLSYLDRQIYRYSTDIAAAWKLDGEGWQWEFDEVTDAANTDGLDVAVWNGKGWYSSHVAWKDFPSKAEAYATGRCLVWLKAVENSDD